MNNCTKLQLTDDYYGDYERFHFRRYIHRRTYIANTVVLYSLSTPVYCMSRKTNNYCSLSDQ